MPRRLSTPWVVLAAALSLSVAATAFVAVAGHERDRAHFESAVASSSDRITARLDVYLALLRGTAALFLASDTVTREDFAGYVQRLAPRRNYPGIQGIGFTRSLAPAEVPELERTLRREFPDFHVWPATARDHYTAIVYLEPLDVRNRVALGFDMASEPVRRAAMLAARDRAYATLTGRVELVQEITTIKQAGFLLYVPVYRGGVTPPTIAERRAQLVGWVYAPFRAGDLFKGIFGTERVPRVRFRVYDGDTTDPRALLYDSAEGARESRTAFRTVRPVDIAGRRWTIAFSGLPALERWSAHAEAPATALVGAVITMVLFLLARSQREARRRAERSDALRTRFFADMSHELRTPLNAIIGYNDLLLAGIYGPMAPAQQQGVERSQRAARHLLELVNDVLDLSKLEAGKLEIVPERVVLPALLDDLATTIRPMADAAGSTLTVRCEPGTPTVSTDPRRVRQILLNLISNAAKFGRGRPIVVRCAPHRDHGALVEVRDEGPGIAPEHQRRIFEEFVQLPDSATEGTGLGLAISHRLALLLGGRLELDSVPGEGSTFRLLLPATAPEG